MKVSSERDVAIREDDIIRRVVDIINRHTAWDCVTSDCEKEIWQYLREQCYGDVIKSTVEDCLGDIFRLVNEQIAEHPYAATNLGVDRATKQYYTTRFNDYE